MKTAFVCKWARFLPPLGFLPSLAARHVRRIHGTATARGCGLHRGRYRGWNNTNTKRPRPFIRPDAAHIWRACLYLWQNGKDVSGLAQSTMRKKPPCAPCKQTPEQADAFRSDGRARQGLGRGNGGIECAVLQQSPPHFTNCSNNYARSRWIFRLPIADYRILLVAILKVARNWYKVPRASKNNMM